MNWLPDGKLPDEISAHPGWKRLEDQRTWYSGRAAHNQRRYMRIKVSQLVLASAIPLLSLIEAVWGRCLTAEVDMEARLATLAMRVEDLVSTEHERWVANVTQAIAEKPGSTAAAIGASLPTR
jgi:hypothetical protein